jgi:WD repeat-containing protein 44
VVSASEDSHVYVWRYDDDSEPGCTKGSVVACTQSYEYFHCQDVTVAVVWPSPTTVCPTLIADKNGLKPNGETNRTTATWPEEIVNSRKSSPKYNSNANPFINSAADIFNCGIPAQTRSAWGMVIVTAGRGGEIRTFQNFGFPVRV